MDFWNMVFLIVIGSAVLMLIVFLLVSLYFGFIGIFAFAAEQGFLGISAYVACWVFLMPVMAVAHFIVGAVMTFGIIALWNEERQIKSAERYNLKKKKTYLMKPETANPKHRPKMGTPEYYEWANREGPYRDP